MLVPTRPANRLLSSMASSTAYTPIWAGTLHVRGLYSSRTVVDTHPQATLPGLPTPHDAAPHRIEPQRSGSAHLRMHRLRSRLRTSRRRSRELGHIGAKLEAAPARGCEPGPPFIGYDEWTSHPVASIKPPRRRSFPAELPHPQGTRPAKLPKVSPSGPSCQKRRKPRLIQRTLSPRSATARPY